MPDAPSPITSPPAKDGQPWDATSTAPVAGWKSVDTEAGTGGDHFAGLPDAGEGGWQQTLLRVTTTLRTGVLAAVTRYAQDLITRWQPLLDQPEGLLAQCRDT